MIRDIRMVWCLNGILKNMGDVDLNNVVLKCMGLWWLGGWIMDDHMKNEKICLLLKSTNTIEIICLLSIKTNLFSYYLSIDLIIM